MIAAPLPVVAAPGEPTPESVSEGPSEATAPEPEIAEPEPSEAAAPEPTEPEPEPEIAEPEVELEEREGPTGGGVAGAVVDPDDPNATRAQSDLEGERLDTSVAGVPERLPKLQAAGWWLVFAGVGAATAGGVLAGIAETREDEAERLAYGFDLQTGQRSVYGEVADEYEDILREGQNFQWAARGLIIAGSAVVVAGLGFFIADAVKRKRERPSARVRFDGTALRF